MRIYPVLDIQAGIVVHAVRGERGHYRPLESEIVDSAEPLAVARALRDRFGTEALYVADLDALRGAPLAEEVLAALVADEFHLLVDAGVHTVGEARRLRRLGIDDVVVALETLPDVGTLKRIVDDSGARNIVFSLDLRDAVPFTASDSWKGRTGEDIALEAFGAGARRMIVLDLTSVGSNEGPAQQDLLKTLRERLPEVELITGGGVRSTGDIEVFRTLGMDGVLVATALHRGTLEIEEPDRDRR